MNQLKNILKQKDKNLLSIFFTAGYPTAESTGEIIEWLEKSGVDFIEVGLPYSDPLADGETIQYSSSIALKNGMNLDTVFEQLATIKKKCNTPLILMGYLNQVIKYGVENFCKKCKSVGIQNLILPDLPIDVYEKNYRVIFSAYRISNIFLITPQTEEKRIRKIDTLTDTFIYVVASSAITGAKEVISAEQIAYFKRIATMNLKNKCIVGFGISNTEMFESVCKFLNGAIVGSAFINFLKESPLEKIPNFINNIRKK